jgi:hypothetical protein
MNLGRHTKHCAIPITMLSMSEVKAIACDIWDFTLYKDDTK